MNRLLRFVALLVALMTTASVASAQNTALLCARDAATLAPLPGVRLSSDVTAGASKQEMLLREFCVALRSVPFAQPGTGVVATRLGYRPATFTLPADAADGDTLWLSLRSIGASVVGATQLETQRVTARRDPTGATTARTTQTLTVEQARATGAGSVNGMIGMLPYVNLRSARGETGLSLRGARREQIAVTLDGMPLNDPATGIADVSDVPLAALQQVTVQLGADPIGAGSGAGGGVLALTTGRQRVLSVRGGAFGQRTAEGAWSDAGGGALWNVSAALRDARNDFAFVNDAAAEPLNETRVNNDERRASLSAGVLGRRAQLSLLGSSSERGMVGAANVRTYDNDRSRTDRLLMRGQLEARGTQLVAGTRLFALDYRDPVRPELDASARAAAVDVEWRGTVASAFASGNADGRTAWRIGGGFDRLRGTGSVEQSRSRGFASVERAWQFGLTGRTPHTTLSAAARVDAIDGSGALPTFTLAGEQRLLGAGEARHLVATARYARAVRVPTLYDLYFSSPQRLFVRTLVPERVNLDASLGARAGMSSSRWQVTVDGSLVARDTRDAIVWFPGNFGWSPANVGVERLRGVEGRAFVGRTIATKARATISAWGTAYDAMLNTNGLRIPTPYVPQIAGGGQLVVSHRARIVSALVRSMGPRPYTAGPRNPEFELPSVTLLDLSISQQVPWHRVDALLSFSLENATNVSWQSVRGFPSPGRGWAIGITLTHSPGRTP